MDFRQNLLDKNILLHGFGGYIEHFDHKHLTADMDSRRDPCGRNVDLQNNRYYYDILPLDIHQFEHLVEILLDRYTRLCALMFDKLHLGRIVKFYKAQNTGPQCTLVDSNIRYPLNNQLCKIRQHS